jgi:hypothetical protein
MTVGMQPDITARDLIPAIVMLDRVQYSMMLDGRSDDVLAAQVPDRRKDRSIIAFRPATGEKDLTRVSIQ